LHSSRYRLQTSNVSSVVFSSTMLRQDMRQMRVIQTPYLWSLTVPSLQGSFKQLWTAHTFFLAPNSGVPWTRASQPSCTEWATPLLHCKDLISSLCFFLGSEPRRVLHKGLSANTLASNTPPSSQDACYFLQIWLQALQACFKQRPFSHHTQRALLPLTVFLAGNSPNIRSCTVHINGPGQPYSCFSSISAPGVL
jgi:hypothetical protein